MVWRRMQFSIVVWSVFLLGALTASGLATTLTGAVTNATTLKPSAGDEVILLDFSGGSLREVARTRSDSDGNFAFRLDAPKPPGMVQVIHQGTSYSKVVAPNTSSLHLRVYDVSRNVKGVVVTADVTRFRAAGDSLQAVRVFVVKNNSAPPQTQMSGRNFEFYLPEGAQIDHSMAHGEGEQPARAVPALQKQKNLYAFPFPLRPGETQFQVLYHMPYSDAVTINPKPVYDVDQLVVMLPNKMHFTAGPGAAFQPVHDPAQNDVTVQIASNTKVGQPLMFTLSGTNSVAETAPPNAGRGQSAAAREDAKTGEDSRPAAGALPPIAAPDPSSKSEWYLLGGFAVLLVAGTLSIARRSTKSRSPRLVQPDIPNDLLLSRATPELADQNKSAFRHLSVAALTLRDPMLRDPTLGDLKEQLFRLEVERKQNRIAQPDYEKAIATLHQSLDQAIKPGNEKAITSAP